MQTDSHYNNLEAKVINIVVVIVDVVIIIGVIITTISILALRVVGFCCCRYLVKGVSSEVQKGPDSEGLLAPEPGHATGTLVVIHTDTVDNCPVGVLVSGRQGARQAGGEGERVHAGLKVDDVVQEIGSACARTKRQFKI